MARNHTDKGVRVSWKIVPAVTEVWYPHPAHSLRLRTGHAFPDPQWAQRKPVGQRSRAKYARHASSVLKFASNSVRLRGYSSTISAHYILGLPESSGYPPRLITTIEGVPDSCLFFHLHNNAAQRCAQRFRKSGHVYQSNIARSPFHISDIGSMYSCKFRELFLGETPTVAQSPHSSPKCWSRIVLFLASHTQTIMLRWLCVYRL